MLRNFLPALFFWISVFACSCSCFHSLKTYCDNSYWLDICVRQSSLSCHRVIFERSYWPPLNAFKFNGCKDLKKSFSKIFLNINRSWTLPVLVLTGFLFISSAAKFNLVSVFIFYLSVIKLQCHEFSYFFRVLGYFFLFLGRFEILSHYPIKDSCHWLREDVHQRIKDKVLSEKLDLNDFDTFLWHSFTEFLVFACFCCCFREF